MRNYEKRKLEIKKREKSTKIEKTIRKNNVDKYAEINESIEKPKEIKSLEEDKNTTDSYPNWFSKNNMEDVDDKLFKEYRNGKNFNSFIKEFDRATNEEDKEKVVEELKNISNFVNHDIFIMNEDREYRSKLIDIVNAIDYFLYEYSKKWVSNFNWGKQSKIIKHFM